MRSTALPDLIEKMVVFIFMVTLLVACGGGGGSGDGDNPGDGEPKGGDSHPLLDRWTATDDQVDPYPGVTGMITLEEYDWFYAGLDGRKFTTRSYLAVIQLDLATGIKRRFLTGYYPTRHSSGDTLFVQNCQPPETLKPTPNRVALADELGLITPISRCSEAYTEDLVPESQLLTDGNGAQFEVGRLSPDGQLVAVEISFYLTEPDFHRAYETVILNLDGELVGQFPIFAPRWMPDGRLLGATADNGIQLSNAALTELERMDNGQIQGPVNNPVVHPSGERIAFEYNQQIWGMNIDGSDLMELVFSDGQLRYPTYSPDGRFLLYLLTYSEDQYEQGLFFTDLQTDISYRFDVKGIVGDASGQGGDSTAVPNGTLTWSP
jgi:hypothetical protein